MIQFTRKGLLDTADLKALRAEFECAHTLRLPQLLHQELVQVILARLNAGKWIDLEHKGIGREVVLIDVIAVNLAHFLANRTEFLDLIRRITGCETITRFDGRIYRMLPGAGHFDSWHDDESDGRLIGMSINLGSSPYSGGVFQLRRKGTGDPLCELPNTGPGDAILFRLSRKLEHRLTPLKGTAPKTAFAGWFFSMGPDYLSMVRDEARRIEFTDQIGNGVRG